eukprot:IDg3174t1
MISFFEEEDSSDDENLAYLIASDMLPGLSSTTEARRHGGSTAGRRTNTPRDFDEAMRRLERDYLCENPRYSENDFERRFRIPAQSSIAGIAHAGVWNCCRCPG